MHYTFNEKWKEKHNDVRLLKRKAHLGSRIAEGTQENVELSPLEQEDCADRATYVDTEELMKNDNPAHSGRNLPAKRSAHIIPIEELDSSDPHIPS